MKTSLKSPSVPLTRRIRGPALLLAAATLGGCFGGSPPQPRNPAPAAGALPALSPGDHIRITVWGKPDYSGEFTVGANGTIADPFYMDVAVVGMPLSEVTRQVRNQIGRYEQEPRVLVEPLVQISVGGEVRQPNLYNVLPEVTIAQAVMLAGGATDRGNLSDGRLWRRGQELELDLTRPSDGLAASRVSSGDQILVPTRRSFIRDYIAPAGSVIGAAAAITNILLRRYW